MNVTPLRINSLSAMLDGTCLGNAPRTVITFLPLAEERKGVIRPLYELAEALDASGWQTLIFDYFGTGDSPGGFAEITWQTLSTDCTAAITSIHEQNQGRIVILGIRLGARLALEQVGRNPGIVDQVILWEPVIDPAAWLRQLRRRSRFRQGTSARQGAAQPMDVDGYMFSPELSAELDARPGIPKPLPCPVIIFTVGNHNRLSPAMTKLGQALGATPRSIQMQPFWMQTGVVDASELIAKTVECLSTAVTNKPEFPDSGV